jgi:hypothetical protein
MSEEHKDKKEGEMNDLKPDKDVKGGGGPKSQSGGTGGITIPNPNPNQ